MRMYLLATLLAITTTFQCNFAVDPSPKDPPPAAVEQQRLMLTHPSWHHKHTLPNIAANADYDGSITGFIVIHAAGYEADRYDDQRTAEIRQRTEKLGLRFICGSRNAHTTAEEFELARTAAWHDAGVTQYLAMIPAGDAFGFDLEPYGFRPTGKPRYHGADDLAALTAACRPYRRMGELFIYPDLQRHAMAQAIARNATGPVINLDQRTFNVVDAHTNGVAAGLAELDRLLAEGEAWSKAHGVIHAPGLYLNYLQRPDVMERVKRFEYVWFFPRTHRRDVDGNLIEHVDDLPRFGSADWRPKVLRVWKVKDGDGVAR